MGFLQECYNIWTNETSADKLGEMLTQLQVAFQAYMAPFILGCMGTSAIVLWQLGWYRILALYVGLSSVTMLLLVALMYYVRNGVEELREREAVMELLIAAVRAMQLRKNQKREGAAVSVDEARIETLDKCL